MVSTKRNTTVASISEIWNYIVGAQKVTWNDIPQHNQNSYKVEYIVLSLNSEAISFAEKTENESLLVSSFQQKSSQKIVHPETAWTCHYKSVHLADGWILKICFCSSIYTSTHAKWIPDCLWQQTFSSYKSIADLFGNTLSPSTMRGHDLAQ